MGNKKNKSGIIKLIVILIIISIIIIGSNYIVENYVGKVKENDTIISNEKENKKTLEYNSVKQTQQIEKSDNIDDEIDKEKIENKIELLRKRYSLKGLIQKGDTYLENQQHILAIQSYLGAIKQNPNDKQITKKIGDTYFEMGKFPSALNYYKELIGSKLIEPKEITLTYFYTLSDKKDKLNIEEIYKNIDSFGLSDEDVFFYKTSTECIIDKNICKKKFQDYIKSGKGKKNTNIQYLKKSLEDYESFQSKEEYLEDTYILSALFQAKLYNITNILSKDILKEKKDYLTVLKIIAKGNFELGDYKEAKKYLLEYNNYKTNNVAEPKINYMLGIINIKLHEYILSNIYFNKSLKEGYKEKSNIYRRLIYNYYLVGDNIRMMKEFKQLINEGEDLNGIDYSLAVYYSIINGKTKQANKWTNKALELFPENDNFYGYKGWIYKESGEYEKAQEYLKKGLKINSSNPLINLNLGIIEENQGNILKAKILFKNTIGEDQYGDFGKFATKELEKIYIEQEKINKEIEQNL